MNQLFWMNITISGIWTKDNEFESVCGLCPYSRKHFLEIIFWNPKWHFFFIYLTYINIIHHAIFPSQVMFYWFEVKKLYISLFIFPFDCFINCWPCFITVNKNHFFFYTFLKESRHVFVILTYPEWGLHEILFLL